MYTASHACRTANPDRETTRIRNHRAATVLVRIDAIESASLIARSPPRRSSSAPESAGNSRRKPIHMHLKRSVRAAAIPHPAVHRRWPLCQRNHHVPHCPGAVRIQEPQCSCVRLSVAIAANSNFSTQRCVHGYSGLLRATIRFPARAARTRAPPDWPMCRSSQVAQIFCPAEDPAIPATASISISELARPPSAHVVGLIFMARA